MSALRPCLFAATLALAAPIAAAWDPVTEGPALVKSADWKAMQVVTVVAEEHSYTPSELRFKAGQPYKLVLRNTGEKDHYFTAPEFFKAIATRKVQVEGKAEVKAPYLAALEVMHGNNQLELFFVPVVKGTYPIYCTIEDHRDKGMDGVIVIE